MSLSRAFTMSINKIAALFVVALSSVVVYQAYFLNDKVQSLEKLLAGIPVNSKCGAEDIRLSPNRLPSNTANLESLIYGAVALALADDRSTRRMTVQRPEPTGEYIDSGKPAAAENTDVEIYRDPIQRAEDILNIAEAKGTWEQQDQMAFLEITAKLDTARKVEMHRRLAVKINSKHITPDGLFF